MKLSVTLYLQLNYLFNLFVFKGRLLHDVRLAGLLLALVIFVVLFCQQLSVCIYKTCVMKLLT
jgi:hypothetical protein